MTCDGKAFVRGKYTITLTVTTLIASIPLVSFTELTLTATLVSDPATIITSTLSGYTPSGGGLIVSGDDLTWETSDTLITVPGKYKLEIIGVVSAQDVPLTVCEPGNVQVFHDRV